jgi:ABC-type transport system involved in multi-copper enzyme maturation permease subunit
MSEFHLFKTSLRDLARPKRLLIAAVLISIPALLAVLMRTRLPSNDFNPDLVYNMLSALVIFGFLLVILSVVFGTGVISQEIEQKTIVYLLTRPVARWRIVLAKFAAAVCAVVVTLWLAALLTTTVLYGFGGSVYRQPTLSASDLRDNDSLFKKLKEHKDPVSAYLWELLPMESKGLLIAPPNLGEMIGDRGPEMLRNMTGNVAPLQQRAVLSHLNNVIRDDQGFYDAERFAAVNLPDTLKREAESKPTGAKLVQLNRALLAAAYPQEVAPAATIVGQLRTDFMMLTVGALAYSALFLLLATILNRPLMWGLLFAFGWESWVPNMPGKFQMVSLMSYLRVLAPHPQPTAGPRGISDLFSMLNPETISASQAWIVLASVIIVALGLAFFIFSTNEYVPREDAE